MRHLFLTAVIYAPPLAVLLATALHLTRTRKGDPS